MSTGISIGLTSTTTRHVDPDRAADNGFADAVLIPTRRIPSAIDLFYYWGMSDSSRSPARGAQHG
jgi:hypothetical protein